MFLEVRKIRDLGAQFCVSAEYTGDSAYWMTVRRDFFIREMASCARTSCCGGSVGNGVSAGSPEMASCARTSCCGGSVGNGVSAGSPEMASCARTSCCGGSVGNGVSAGSPEMASCARTSCCGGSVGNGVSAGSPKMASGALTSCCAGSVGNGVSGGSPPWLHVLCPAALQQQHVYFTARVKLGWQSGAALAEGAFGNKRLTASRRWRVVNGKIKIQWGRHGFDGGCRDPKACRAPPALNRVEN